MRLQIEATPTVSPLAVPAESPEQYDFETYLRDGIAAAHAGERDNARTLLTIAADLNPRSEDVWIWLASISEYPEELLAFLNNVLQINPDNQRALEWRSATKALLAKTLVQCGIDAHQNGSVMQAATFFEQAIANDPKCEMAWFWLAGIAVDDADKRSYLDRVLEINPSNEHARQALNDMDRARVERSLNAAKEAAVSGQHETALTLIDEVLSEDPANADAWMLRSHFSVNFSEKVASLERVLELQPENAAASASLGFLRSTMPVSVPAIDDVHEEAVTDEPAELNETLEAAEPAQEATEEKETATVYQFKPWVQTTEDPVAHGSAEDAAYETEEHDAFHEAAVSEPEQSDEPAYDTFETEAHDTFHEMAPSEPEQSDEPAYDTFETEAHTFHEMIMSEPEQADEPTSHEYHAEAPAEESLPEWKPAEVENYQAETAPSYENLFHNGHEADHSDIDPEPEPEMEMGSEPEAAAPFTFDAAPEYIGEPEPEPIIEDAVEAIAEAEPSHFEPPVMHEGPACPYCHSRSNAGGFECGSCGALLTLSDLEALFSGPNVDREIVSSAVTALEAQKAFGEMSAEQLITLAIGHFNLGGLEQGFMYLREASSLDPNNVILAGYVNTVAIRLDEISRRSEINNALPKGKSILVIDDSATVRKLISGKLEKSGHNVICASDGVEGLERLAERTPDLVLLDIGMPRMDGYEVCRQIRASDIARNLPVVMISGKDGFFDKVRGRMAGATGYVTKPFGPETLMKALETYLSPDFVPVQPADIADTDTAVTNEFSLNA